MTLAVHENANNVKSAMLARVRAVKDHLLENRNVYVALAAGMGGGMLIAKRTPSLKISNLRVLSKGDNFNIIVQALGDPGNVVQCVETGTIYASQGQAARELGAHASVISKHLAGVLENVNGYHLRILGKAGEVLSGS